MALDATVGGAASESLATVAQANTYHTNRGNAAWAALSDALREIALRKATDYLGEFYGPAWAGCRATDTQALDWPRLGVTAYEVLISELIIPPRVVDACALLALKAATVATLTPDLTRAIVRQKIGPLETEYADYSPQSKRYLEVDRMLAPYLDERNPYAARLERS